MCRGELKITTNNLNQNKTMCGIVYCESRNGGSVQKAVLKRYRKQAHRGKQGFAFLPIRDKIIGTIERAEGESEILEKLKNELADKILFHHRFPTSTINLAEVTHPICVKSDLLEYNYFVVHNGVLQNELELKKKFELEGFVYNTVIKTATRHEVAGKMYYGNEVETFNDSESLAIDLAKYLDGKSKSLLSRGSIAFICVKTDKQGNAIELFFGRNEGNPLFIEDNNNVFSLKSEGSGKSIEPDRLYHYSLQDDKREIYYRDLAIGEYYNKKLPVKYFPADKPRVIDITEYEDDIYSVRSPYKRNSRGELVDDFSERQDRSEDFETDQHGIIKHLKDNLCDDLDDIPSPSNAVIDLYEDLAKIEDEIIEVRALMENLKENSDWESVAMCTDELEALYRNLDRVSAEILREETTY